MNEIPTRTEAEKTDGALRSFLTLLASLALVAGVALISTAAAEPGDQYVMAFGGSLLIGSAIRMTVSAARMGGRR
jgi:hypothetical protein